MTPNSNFIFDQANSESMYLVSNDIHDLVINNVT